MSNYSTTNFGVDRRKRLYLALSPVLSADQVLDALWLWEREFSVHAPFAVAGYADRLAAELGMPSASQDLLAHVTQGIQAGEASLPEDPIQQMLAFESRRPSGAPGLSSLTPQAAAPAEKSAEPALAPDAAVFNELVDGILAGAARRERGSDAELRKYLRSGGLLSSVSSQAALDSWVVGQRTRISGFSQAEMSSLLNNIYVWLAEEFGPIQVDRIFGDAVRLADALPEAASFSPRKLL